jgi:parvulin-like peptidyl-prolyl isomerase
MRFRKEQANVVSDDEFKALMESQGLSLDKLRRAEERQFIANEFIRSMIFPHIQKIGHAELRTYYDEHPADFMAEDKVRWQDIFIDAAKHQSRQTARLFAEQIAQRARKGEDFALLVKQFDDGDSSFRNGEGYGQRQGEIKPLECEKVLFEMKDGDVALIEIATGYHVIRLAERTYAGKIPFDAKTQNDIRRKLQNIIAEREYKRAVNEIKRKATIQIVDSDG